MKQKPFDSAIIKKVIKEAKSERDLSDFRFFKLGAVIFSSKRILVSGHNTNRTNPTQAEYNKYRPYHCESCACHAEISALIRLRRNFPDIRAQDVGILVYRETATGERALAKPCPACERALRDYGITDIYYTGQNSLVYEKYELWESWK